MRFIIILFALFFSLPTFAQALLFSKSFVDLKGGQSITIIQNSGRDTLHLKGRYFSFLLTSETDLNFSIAPGKKDTLTLDLFYPDFIDFGSFRIFNGPHKTLVCDVRGLKPGSLSITFSGDLSAENEYYLAYQNQSKGFLQESRPYYALGGDLKDMNAFPALADSINKETLAFLKDYKKPLLAWFRKHEEWRLNYNNGFRKYHVPFQKEFNLGQKINLNPSYYSFEKELPLDSKEMVLNTDYLWYAMFYLRQTSLSINADKVKKDPMIYVIDSLFKEKEIGDVLKIKRILDMSRESKSSFYNILQATYFKNPDNKKILDSLVYSNVGLPLIGKSSPVISLKDIYDKNVTLDNFTDKVVILNFWASWCLPCIKEFPFENKLYQKYKNRDVVVVNICIDTDKAKWKEISTVKDLQMVNLYADAEHTLLIRKLYDLSYLPKSILIDKKGFVRDNDFKRASEIKFSDFERYLKD